ncbi:hypothetical protein DHW03_10985 [Pedobacter yonginense]|uniref:Uncharacterized protein n=1 Tax=Pedobacter yonginense TaxID=651869 RepID=A0A317END3_9SPHI|nr:hypothetical protein [Pedobacter yonginense]PWS28072.1 hypothetical protein DHW03_10985 [Pedobacter yonginense]
MKTWLCVILATGIFSLCYSNIEVQDENIVAIDIKSKIELVHLPDGQLLKYDFEYQHLYLDSLNIVREIITRTTPTEIMKITDSLVNENSLIVDTLYKYFLFNQSRKHGLLIDSLRSINGKVFSVDSLRNVKRWGNFNLDSFKLVAVINNPNLHQVIAEKYHKPNKDLSDENDPDSLYLFYDKSLNNIPFSFSSKIDEEKKAKLSKIQVVFNSRKSDKFMLTLPRRAYSFEIVRAQIKDRKKILDFFNLIRTKNLD